MKVLLLTALMLVSAANLYSQDTTVRKRFIDSLRHELSTYTIMSYNHLNMYDRAEAEKYIVKQELIATNEYVKYLEKVQKKRAAKHKILFTVTIALYTAVLYKFIK